MVAWLLAKMDAHQEKMEVNMDAWLEKMMAYEEITEACVGKLKANREKSEAVA
jgi:hypothetical protein